MQNSIDADFENAEKFLYELRNAGSKFSLDRIKALCAALGNPQDAYPEIHVAGTNGKGSVCALLESVLRASGLKVGLFTSPHLTYLGERVQVGRVPIPKPELLRLVGRVRSVCDAVFDASDIDNYPSFFEFMTAVCFVYFAEMKVDVAVVEVGLGGRLDSTNIIAPACCVITSIGLDHTDYLGETLEKIAFEKAGIIKESVPVVAGFLPDAAMSVVREKAEEKSAPLYEVSDFFGEGNMPECALAGRYQRRNAAVAKLCLKVLKGLGGIFSGIDEASINAGFARVQWAARWQEIALKNGSTLILDASHNPEGARALDENLADLLAKSGGKKPVICVGVLGRERASALLKVVRKYAARVVLLVPNQPRALGFEELEELLGGGVPAVRARVGEVFCRGGCALVGAGEVVVSTGSIYLAGEVLAALRGGAGDGLSDVI